VLLNFWATWCGPCKAEIPWFEEFQRNYARQGLSVIGISMDEDGWKVVRPYMESAKINYRIAIGDDALAQKFGGVTSLPETFLVDRNGRIAGRHVGVVSKSDYQSEIVRLLKK
jgi:thiol-disulfide isomerase/thioredoxin